MSQSVSARRELSFTLTFHSEIDRLLCLAGVKTSANYQRRDWQASYEARIHRELALSLQVQPGDAGDES